ncbi:hypothetical protein [Leptospira harrisiae]|uniref:SGNH/GDSL hydrolase family protein n=1 Tax=Leptospira harrisiae TaxID=2023189 RepID=A0A2N0ALR1_9LEPT|nr:hypothetical protein [Leptospira harrisiae]PJZ85234.1 hypothetical protein CH364_02950 [Leptospira harrisiae]PKA08768.1 hypothetical protein CH366_03090 [Leptospira harrisiae]
MKLRYFFITFLTISFVMHMTEEWIIQFCETTSVYWYFANERTVRTEAKVLVLGDSQIVSGISPESIAEIEGVSKEEVLYLPKPSQQPEGILSDSLDVVYRLPNLKKVYVNLSPLNTSKNSVTDANRQLFYSFGNLSKYTIEHPLLRKAYFSNLTDLSWKIIIKVFPYFGLSSNINRLVYDPVAQNDIPRRKQEFLFIKESMKNNQGSWVWKSIGEDPTLLKSEEFPNLNTQILAGKRELSIQLWLECIRLWEKQNLEIVFLRIPFSPKMEKDIIKTGANLVEDEFFKRISSDPNRRKLKVLDFKSEFLEEYQYFADLTHLNQKGKDAFSVILKRVLFYHAHSSTEGM